MAPQSAQNVTEEMEEKSPSFLSFSAGNRGLIVSATEPESIMHRRESALDQAKGNNGMFSSVSSSTLNRNFPVSVCSES